MSLGVSAKKKNKEWGLKYTYKTIEERNKYFSTRVIR